MISRIYMPNQVIYGDGALAEVGTIARSYGRNVLIISDPVMDRIGVVAQCERYLADLGCEVLVYSDVDQEPTDKHVEVALKYCKHQGSHVIIGLGGGSAIDTAKAVAVLMTNEGPLDSYVGNKRTFQQPALPLIAIPTTAGTGSEVTKVTVIINTETDVKMMISQPELMPKYAIIDPVLTYTCPKNVTAASGIDALCHAIEAYLSRHAHRLTDTYALEAIELIVRNLPAAYENGKDAEARANMAYAATLAGMAFSNASVTLIHGMSRPIGALFHVPHGISNAMLLPAVLEATIEHAPERMAQLEMHLNPAAKNSGESDQQLAKQFVERMKQLCKELNIPNLKDWGIDEDAFNKQLIKMSEDALASGSPGNHPYVPTRDELVGLYKQCFNYTM